MKKIVLSGVVAVVVTVGIYLAVLALGASQGSAVVAAAAEDEGIRFLWAISAYALEGVAIGGALVVGSVLGSVAFALAGVIALLVLWRFSPKPQIVSSGPASVLAPSGHNGD